MQILHKQLAKVWRRLWLQSWLNHLGWFWIAAFTVCFVAMLVPKFWFIPYTFDSWSRVWMIGAAIAAIGLSLLRSWWTSPSRLAAAVELDRRFSLRERCSSALVLESQDRDSAVGKALIQDTQHQLERIDIRDQFPIRPAPQIGWTALPMAACIALFWVPDAQIVSDPMAGNSPSQPMVNVKNSTQPILKAVQKKRQEAEEAGDLEAAEDFKRIEDKINALRNTQEADRKKVLADLNSIKQELQQKRDALGGGDRMKKSLENLKDLDKGPAEKLAKALKDGDLEQAEKELEQVIEGLKSGSLDEQQAKQLEKQLEQMKKAIQEAQSKREQAKEEARRELEKAEQEGNTEKAAALRKQLEKLGDGEKESQAMEKIQSQLAKAQQAMKEGDKQAAAKALEEMQEQIGELSENQANSEELEEMLEQFEEAKNASKCDQCQGEGCSECQKGSKGNQGKKGQRGEKGKGKGKGNGDGMGEGQGEGDRDEEESDFNEYDAQVRDQMRKGETINGGKVGGKNRKGVTREEARDAVLSSQPDEPDAIENIQLPKAQRDQLKEYFNSLRGGEKKN
jgi:chemotaxis protein histidine kinase CheA